MHRHFRKFTTAFLAAALLLTALGIGSASAAGNETIDSFSKAKKMLERQVYFDHRVTLYCGASFDEKKNIDLPDGFFTEKHQKRASKVEWEHAVPAENFGRAFEEWREGHPQCVSKGKPFKGRKCAEKVNMEYRHMQADMYNLFPAIGAVNAVRSNKQYSELPSAPSAFGICEAKVDGNRFEPPARSKGQLARAALYMADSYGKYRLSRQQEQLFNAWNRMFPVDQWECTRAKRIEKLQGNENRFVKEPCQQAGLW